MFILIKIPISISLYRFNRMRHWINYLTHIWNIYTSLFSLLILLISCSIQCTKFTDSIRFDPMNSVNALTNLQPDWKHNTRLKSLGEQRDSRAFSAHLVFFHRKVKPSRTSSRRYIVHRVRQFHRAAATVAREASFETQRPRTRGRTYESSRAFAASSRASTHVRVRAR